MNDIEKRDNIPSTSNLSKLGITAISYTAGGIFILILNALSKIPVLGLIAGAIVCAVGIMSLMSKDKADKKAGAIITGVGALVLLSKLPVVAHIAPALLAIGAVGLLALGVWNGVKFFLGLKKRS
ncbi:MAG: hypothetical protein FWC03_12290 [Treponema sp.]|nr:hypothetical protein [Treponema sp.]